MKVLVFSKFKHTSLMSRVKRAEDGLVIDVLPLNALGRTLPALGKGSLIYLDIAGLGPRDLSKRLALIEEHPEVLFGIIDFTGIIGDPAEFFRKGAVDFLGKPLSRTGLTAQRTSEVITFARLLRAHADIPLVQEIPTTVRGWSDVVEGREYPFYFLYVEIDDSEEMKKRYGQDDLAHALDTFRSFVERSVSPYGGKLWMWSGFGGMALFPFGEQGCPPMVCALRLLLWRPFYDVEESPLPYYLSFRLALSYGVMAFSEKKTGRIISESLNSAFHLGQRFTERGRFTLTADVFHSVPDPLRDFCIPVGAFEGKKIYRVRTPVYPSTQSPQPSSQTREGE